LSHRRALPPLVGLVVNLTQQTSLAPSSACSTFLEASQLFDRAASPSPVARPTAVPSQCRPRVFFIICLQLTMLSRWLEQVLR